MLKDKIGNEPITYSNVKAGKFLNDYAEEIASVIQMISHVDGIGIDYIENLYAKLSRVSDDPLTCQTLRNEIEMLTELTDEGGK